MFMKKLLRTALLCALAMFSTAVMADTTTVGNEDNSSGWWTAFSDCYAIAANQTLHLEFTNYHCTDAEAVANGWGADTEGVGAGYKNWFNPALVLANAVGHSAEETAGYAEYLVVRMDNYGWGTAYSDAGNSSNWNWDAFESITNGAKVTMDVIRNGAAVSVKMNIQGSDGNAYYQNYNVNIAEAEATVYASLTVQYGHIVIDNAATTTTATAVEGAWVYENALSAAGNGVSIVGNGSFVADDTFGTVFQNDGTAKRSSYLLLPEDLLAHSADSKALTIGFWVNNAGAAADSYAWAPLFTAYAAAPANGVNTFPMLACQYRGVLQVNCAGWSDFADAQNVAGTNTLYHYATDWLAGGGWHYYTVVFEGENAKVYVDGKLKNEWDNTLVVDRTQQGLFSNGSELKYICLGGNQAWDWGDNDTPFKYAKLRVQNSAMTADEIAAQMLADNPNQGAGVEPVTIEGTAIGSADLTTGWWSAFSDYYTLGKNKVLTLEFTNYTNKVNNYNNWLLVVTTDADRPAAPAARRAGAEYAEYFVLRADNYCWGKYGNSDPNSAEYYAGYVLTSNYNWDTFKDDMYGAKVKLTVTRDGAKIVAHAVITTAGGTEYFERLEVDGCDDGEQTIRAFLSTDGGCLDLTSSEITDNPAPTGIETVRTQQSVDGIRYNLAGQKVAKGYKGLVIENGVKHVVK